jgi:oligoribonuclease NrnB/cAMP/cGMP phosphodiesterase (DHH superfamily)
MFLNEFVNKTVSEMLNNRFHDESFNKIVAETVRRTVEECALLVSDYVDHKIPASEYPKLLRDSFK